MDDRELFAGEGELSALVRTHDWASTPLGPVSGWSQALRTMVGLLLRNRFPLLLWWGPKFIQIYNDAYAPILGAKHPDRALGKPVAECWAEIIDIIGPMLEAPFRGEPATASDDLFLMIQRKGFIEETHFKVAYSPVPDESVPSGIGGVLATVAEITDEVYGKRQLATLGQLARQAADAKTAEAACEWAARTMVQNPNDIPCALFYLSDDAHATRLVTLAGCRTNDVVPEDLERLDGPGSPIERVMRARRAEVVAIKPVALEHRACQESPRRAIMLPLATPEQSQVYGVLVVALSPHRELNEQYRTFLELAAEHVSSAIRNARAYQRERERAERLAELDRAKTTFFSNVSHEFRTPLTLMLGPVEDALGSAAGLTGPNLTTVHRNALRLLKLVNSLLDFARIEAGRIEANFVASDLAKTTRDLASVFRSAIERGGLVLDVSGIEDQAEPAYIDRDMWEKIVLNLLSNALKFTFTGTITVGLRSTAEHFVLTVADTGIGIASEDMPRLFERFHRIRGVRARTQEGTGIGLALILELAKLHGGDVQATSEPGMGTRFVVRIRRGHAHVPADRLEIRTAPASPALGATPFVEEALRWLPAAKTASSPRLPMPSELPKREDSQRARVLIADDNADMREYVTRLLASRYDVEPVADGAATLRAIQRHLPDLVLADVMMPNLDGFELVRALRADPRARGLPIVLLSARAGEEATTEGLATGADDYIVKPFSARELVARIEAQLIRSQMRAREAAHRNYITTVFRHAPVGIAIFEGPEHVFTFANARFLQLIPHKSEAALIGSGIRQALPELAGQGVFEILDEVCRSGEPYTGRSFRLEFARGEQGTRDAGFFDFVYQPIRDDHGRTEGCIVVVYDVSELARARAEAEAANRAKDEFLAMLGHELRNPLAPIVNALELMRMDEHAARGRAIIERQTRHLMRLVDDLLDISRITRGKLALTYTQVDVAAVVADAIETAAPLFAQHGHRVRAEIPRGQYFVRGERIRLAQVIANLLTNAAKYTDPGGVIEVKLAADQSRVAIEVRDNGRGIHPELLPRVFELFEQGPRTLDRAQGGLGIGLAIVRSLVALHGGTVHAHSDGIGRGSVFTVYLPLIEVPSAVAPRRDKANAAARVSDSSGNDLRILIVDDNQDAADMLEDVLRVMGYATRTAYDGEAALEAASQFQPEVALIDIGLPTMNGYTLAGKLRGMFDDQLQLIAITGYGQESDRRRATASGFDQLFVKPMEIARLTAYLDQLRTHA